MRSVEPLYPRNSVLDYKFKKKIPFPVQVELINAGHHHLKTHGYLILCAEMGLGKTFISSAITCVEEKNNRTLVMAPSIMLEKWKEEILDEIPNASATILSNFSDVVALSHLKGVEPKGNEYYIISKDFAKLSYEEIPCVNRSVTKTVPFKRCQECGTFQYDSAFRTECHCGSMEFDKLRSSYTLTAARCEDCGELVFPQKTYLSSPSYHSSDDTNPVTIEDFSRKSSSNIVCCHCKALQWGPSVNNLKLDNEYSSIQEKKNPWMKIAVARNKANKGTVTRYILKSQYDLSSKYGILQETPHRIVSFQKNRKYSPSTYMKKVLGKGFFQYGLFDECHQFKSGESAQAYSFTELLTCCQKKIAMTGTIAGGMASDLFYLLFRLDPKLMLDRGYSYKDCMKFSSDYGVVEEVRLYDDEVTYYNKTSKGRQSGSKKIKPGISPLLYSGFLISNTMFASLSDVRSFMVEHTEIPIKVPMEKKQKKLYTEVQNVLKENIRQKGGNRLLGQVMPVLMSLPDIMIMNDIVHPSTGHTLFSFHEPKENFFGDDGLLNKERELVRIIKEELSEGRNCFVYCDYTAEGDKNVTNRLKLIIENELNIHGQVEVLTANSPSARKRMGWIKDKASKGNKVIITNPRCVEVGRALVSA